MKLTGYLMLMAAVVALVSVSCNDKKDELKLSRHIVRAPFTGTFTQVSNEVGSFANIGTKVAKAIRINTMELEIPLEKIDAEWVSIGDKVKDPLIKEINPAILSKP